MASELVGCRSCGAQVAKSASTCPSCGISVPGASAACRFIGVVVTIIGIICVCATVLPMLAK